MKAKLFYYLLFIQIVLLPACMVGKKYKPPPEPTGISYRDSVFTDTSQLLKWFDLYKDPVLQTLIKTTIDSNRNLLEAVARVDEARYQTIVVKANLYPSLGYSAQAGGGKSGTEAQKVAGGIQGGLVNAFGVLNWEIDIWGRLRHANRAALAHYFSVEQNRNALQVSLVAEVASDYFILLDLDNRLAIAKQTLTSRKEYTRIITERFEKGYVAEVDRFQAIQQEALVAASIPSLQRQIYLTENALRLLMGQGPGTIPRGTNIFNQTVSPDIPVGLPSTLLQRRPDIIAAEKNMQTEFELIGSAQANRFPSFSLTGFLGFASPQLSTFLSNKGLVANGFGNITGPIFNFGQRKNVVEAQRQRYEQVNYQYQQTVLAAFGDVDNALNSYKTFADEYNQLTIEVDASSKALVLSQAKYDNGYTSYLEVIVMQTNLFDAQLAQSAALQGKLNSIVLLYKALGGGWQ